MPEFCEVALPVPLDRTFTYRVNPAQDPPPVGGRVIVPFRQQKLIGVVMRLHSDPPPVEAKLVESVLDREPVLSPAMLDLAAWTAAYYLAPPGEVLRTMLPLVAEVRRRLWYRITDAGRNILLAGAERGASRRSRRTPEEQDAEYAVLNYLADGAPAASAAIRAATGAAQALLLGMVRKKWLVREEEAEPRDARRMTRFAVLAPCERLPRLNANQQAILAGLAGAGGSASVESLRRLGTPASTLATLVRRNLVRIEDRPSDFHYSSLDPSARPLAREALNAEQRAALHAICEAVDGGKFHVHLLHGVTGSGKTAVYLAAMRHALDRGRSAILLVPEIGLTPAMAAQLHAAFGEEIALLHSALTPEERAGQWRRLRAGAARIAVGTRSAIFAPLPGPGLILVDEEHDSSYKQEETPRYHARDIAVMRAKLAGAAVVLGSATPSLESWVNCETGKYALLEMRERVHGRPMPAVDLVDMRREFQETGQEHLFSRALIEQTQAALGRGEQAVILLNRRGFSFVVLCRACGEKLQCENCAIALTYHKPAEMLGEEAPPGHRLECHYCGYKRTVPRKCPGCGSEHLYFLGAGSQQGEQRLREIFPQARIGRMDRDTIRGRHAMESLLARLHSGEINLLVGTQMIAKGHDIHGVTLVGVVGADHALSLPDFRAAERVFQLLTQVSGRAGRGELPGRVLVQTYYPEHYSIQCAAHHDFHAFLRQELKYRKALRYPPYTALTNVLVQSERLEEAAGWATHLGRWFTRTQPEGVRMLGPATAPIARIKRIYRFHLLLKAARRQALGAALRAMLAEAERQGIPRRNLTVDVDAVSLM